MYQIQNNCLITEQGTVVFDHPIKKVVELGDRLIIRLKILDEAEETNNIYAVQSGKILWRVQDQMEFNPLVNYPNDWGYHVYVEVKPYEKNPQMILATDFGGFRFLIDSKNGKLVEEIVWVR